MPRAHPESGQAAVETVALLPLLVLLVAVAWQAALAGHALWVTSGAASAAARAQAVGGDPGAAARARLPAALERGMRLEAGGADVTLRVRIPRLPLLPGLGRLTARGHFEEQG